jgi:hypothetical protein
MSRAIFGDGRELARSGRCLTARVLQGSRRSRHVRVRSSGRFRGRSSSGPEASFRFAALPQASTDHEGTGRCRPTANDFLPPGLGARVRGILALLRFGANAADQSAIDRQAGGEHRQSEKEHVSVRRGRDRRCSGPDPSVGARTSDGKGRDRTIEAGDAGVQLRAIPDLRHEPRRSLEDRRFGDRPPSAAGMRRSDRREVRRDRKGGPVAVSASRRRLSLCRPTSSPGPFRSRSGPPISANFMYDRRYNGIITEPRR